MKESLEDYIRVTRERYARRTGKRARSALLDEFCENSGFERKYAIKVLNGERRTGPSGAPRGATSRYSPQDIAVFKNIWFLAGQPCGKRFAGEMLALWIASWEKHEGPLEPGQAARLALISAAQIDRETAAWRTTGRKRRIAGAGLAALQREVAVRCEPWAETGPGALEIDTVALCGGSLSGAIVWALSATDIHSGWTEVRAVWNRGAHATLASLRELEGALPFPITKLDFDNGTEFLNAHFVTHFKGRNPKVLLSRSRPYRKNDNAHIEQKNYTHVRQLLGDDRFDEFDLVEPLNEALALWSLWNNLHCAQRRLLRKERQPDGKVKRHHEKRASSPSRRLLARADLEPGQRKKLLDLHEEHDPITLRTQVEESLRRVYELRAALLAERDVEAEPDKEEPTPAARPCRGTGLRSARSVASGSLSSLRSSPSPCTPTGEAHHAAESPLPTQPHRTKTTKATVSSTVRHQATP